MFHVHMKNIPHVEDIILNDLGPRDLVKAKQVSKGWAYAVRRYVGQLSKERTSDLLEKAFLEPVQTHVTVKLPQKVMDLTINDNNKVFILGEKSILQLNPVNFHVSRNLVLERSKDAGDCGNDIEGRWILFASKTGRNFQVKNKRHTLKFRISGSGDILKYVGIAAGRSNNGNDEVIGTRILPRKLPQRLDLRKGLQASDIIQLPNGIYMCAVEKAGAQEPRTQIYVFGKIFQIFEGGEMERLWFRYATLIAPKLIATVPMRGVKLRVVGTRVFCYSSGLGNTVIVFDVWNPSSVEIHGENVDVTTETTRRVSKRKLLNTPCTLCRHRRTCDTDCVTPCKDLGDFPPPHDMFICQRCIHRQYIITCNVCNHAFYCEHIMATYQQ